MYTLCEAYKISFLISRDSRNNSRSRYWQLVRCVFHFSVIENINDQTRFIAARFVFDLHIVELMEWTMVGCTLQGKATSITAQRTARGSGQQRANWTVSGRQLTHVLVTFLVDVLQCAGSCHGGRKQLSLSCVEYLTTTHARL